MVGCAFDQKPRTARETDHAALSVWLKRDPAAADDPSHRRRHTTADIGEPTTFCTFQEVLRSDAEDEEYEAAVLKWIYGYNAYERLGSALNATVGSLWQEMSDTGEFPVDAGVDALRAWAFVIARAHDKMGHPDTTLVCHEELPLILEAIRRHPASGINDLPPLPPSQRT